MDIYKETLSVKKVLRESDKRNFRRMPVNIFASCERDHHDAFPACSHFVSYTKDLSPIGGRFIVGEDFKVGQHFTMSLELPVNFLPLLIDCEVIWIKRSEEQDSNTKGIVEAGVRFVKLDSPYDEEKLKNYLSLV